MSSYKLPIIIFAVLVLLLGIGLNIDPRKVPSPFIDKPAPAFSLPKFEQPDQMISNADFKGKPWMLNVFASWCVTCLQEHPQITQLAQHITLVGLNKEDKTHEARRWLYQHGNPYHTIVVDADGKASIDWGVYAVPETFIIDKKGVVRYKRIGAVTPEDMADTILPLIEKLKAEQG